MKSTIEIIKETIDLDDYSLIEELLENRKYKRIEKFLKVPEHTIELYDRDYKNDLLNR